MFLLSNFNHNLVKGSQTVKCREIEIGMDTVMAKLRCIVVTAANVINKRGNFYDY
jgi:hypothetical protein